MFAGVLVTFLLSLIWNFWFCAYYFNFTGENLLKNDQSTVFKGAIILFINNVGFDNITDCHTFSSIAIYYIV